MQRSRFALETLLGLILEVYHGLEGFANGFGTGLKRAFLTTFKCSLAPQNLPETRHNVCFEL